MSEQYQGSLTEFAPAAPEVSRFSLRDRAKQAGQSALRGAHAGAERARSAANDPRLREVASNVGDRAGDAWGATRERAEAALDDPRTQAAAEAARQRVVSEAGAARGRLEDEYVNPRTGKLRKARIARRAAGALVNPVGAARDVAEIATGTEISAKGAKKFAGQMARGVGKDAAQAAVREHRRGEAPALSAASWDTAPASSFDAPPAYDDWGMGPTRPSSERPPVYGSAPSLDRAPDYMTGQPVEDGWGVGSSNPQGETPPVYGAESPPPLPGWGDEVPLPPMAPPKF